MIDIAQKAQQGLGFAKEENIESQATKAVLRYKR